MNADSYYQGLYARRLAEELAISGYDVDEWDILDALGVAGLGLTTRAAEAAAASLAYVNGLAAQQ